MLFNSKRLGLYKFRFLKWIWYNRISQEFTTVDRENVFSLKAGGQTIYLIFIHSFCILLYDLFSHHNIIKG